MSDYLNTDEPGRRGPSRRRPHPARRARLVTGVLSAAGVAGITGYLAVAADGARHGGDDRLDERGDHRADGGDHRDHGVGQHRRHNGHVRSHDTDDRGQHHIDHDIGHRQGGDAVLVVLDDEPRQLSAYVRCSCAVNAGVTGSALVHAGLAAWASASVGWRTSGEGAVSSSNTPPGQGASDHWSWSVVQRRAARGGYLPPDRVAELERLGVKRVRRSARPT